MSRYSRHNPEEPIRHDWLAGARTSKTQGSFAAPDGSARYIPVRCLECGWEDGLRADLVAAGVMFIYCDQCEDTTVSEVIEPNDRGQARRDKTNV